MDKTPADRIRQLRSEARERNLFEEDDDERLKERLGGDSGPQAPPQQRLGPKPSPGSHTPSENIGRWYENAGGFDNAVRAAQDAMQTRDNLQAAEPMPARSPVLCRERWPRWAADSVYRPVGEERFRPDDPHGARGLYDPARDAIRLKEGVRNGPAVREHEHTHAYTMRGLTEGSGHSYAAPMRWANAGSELSRAGLHDFIEYIQEPREIDVRLAEIKRRYAHHTGDLVDSPAAAKQAWDWWRANQNVVYPDYDSPDKDDYPTMDDRQFEHYDKLPDEVKELFYKRMPELVRSRRNGPKYLG